MSFITDLISMLSDIFGKKPVGSNMETTAIEPPKDYSKNKFHQKSLVKIATLCPDLQVLARQFLDKCFDADIEIQIYYGFRTKEEQQTLYNIGRDANGKIVNPKIIVTNAKPGTSAHETGQAFDCAPIVNDKIDWDSAEATQQYEKMGPIGEELGLVWGARFKSRPDRPHFQLASF